MTKGKDYYQHLIKRYLNNDCSPLEVKELLEYMGEDASNKLLLRQLDQSFREMWQNSALQYPLEADQKMQERLLKAIQPNAKIVPFYKKWLPRVAAILLICSGLAVYQYYSHRQQQPVVPLAKSAAPKSPQKEILPGSDKALLTLSDGSVIVLDEVKNGTVAKQGSISVNKKDGSLEYDASNSSRASTGEITYNTVSTPNGGQYQVVLPDGSKVWLNATSSLRFPTAFSGDERDVELKGEGYFEIARNPAKPFHVKLNSVEVEVLGTHFNIMAYDNEEVIKTTLLEGSVKIRHGLLTKTLVPGQQAKFDHADENISIATADTEEAVAWKNGYFQFNNQDIKYIMRQFARWYDMEVSYEGNARPRYFSGEMSRNVNLSQALKVLELSNVQFRIEGKKMVLLY